ncbi:MAG: transposase [Chryseobacterium sp.]|nr:transposase [Chryseobacterium sp.]
MTYIAFSTNRGFASIEDNFVNGFQRVVLVYDCWSSHFKTVCKTHQLCTAHLTRKLVFFEERYQSKWATDFINLIHQALELKKNLTQEEYQKPTIKRTEILLELNILLQTSVPKEQKDLCAFHKRMAKYKDYIFTFLFYYYVPPDNNARNVQ